MKQRTRSMLSGDDLNGYTMLGGKHEEDYNGEVQLHRIKPVEHFIEAQVQEGDTLQAIALRFYCSISELKRINQIHKDNEIYARRTIKVPVTPYSVLTELIPAQQPQPVPSTSNHIPNLTIHNLLQNPVQNIVTNHQNNQHESTDSKDCAIDCNAVVLNSTVAPAVVPYTDSEITENMSEDSKLLPDKPKISVEAVVVKELTSHGADFGCKWFHLVCIVLILGVVIPLVYILFYLDKHEHSDLHSTR
ncbi:lysM and putative peptidoglycan-binding domain-containing protein 3 isoform X2 [Epargyreus clarus]|uniref:lysM and putative peptidoglycan-binding domain-containing protein 3 isoform X2 n=1 Tax=Epargyreus clarus TaxID=520877 RepID=UPI003C30CFBF